MDRRLQLFVCILVTGGVFHSQTCADGDELRCSASDMTSLQQHFDWLTRRTTHSEKSALHDAVKAYIVARHPSLVATLSAEFLSAPTEPPQLTAYRIFAENGRFINAYTSPDVYASHVEHMLLVHPTVVKITIDNMHIFMDATITVLGQLIAAREEKITWEVCMNDMISTARRISQNYEFHARCDVTASTMANQQQQQQQHQQQNQDAVRGTINFTQPVVDIRTTVSIDLTGFQPGSHDRQYSIFIHEGGTTKDRPMKAGPHFSMTSTDNSRRVGDLGNIEVHRDGRVIHTKVNQLISLFGPNNIVAKTLVIHAVEDGLDIECIASCVVYQTYD